MEENNKIPELESRFPPSAPCSCVECRNFCARPGWWTVCEAGKAIESGLAGRMMLEISPGNDFAVLSPAFKGNEVNYALKVYSGNGCTFLNDGLCELHGTELQPLECRYCHHSRKRKGHKCHLAIEREWNTPYAKKLVVKWGNITGFWRRQGFVMVER